MRPSYSMSCPLSKHLQMEVGLDKGTTAVFKHGKLTKSQNISLSNHTVRGNTELDKTY